ncbi:hypothetical protein PVAP13_9NG642300 [Panicum virgatum]|uniref:Uncharacterized protein n=1 Tax=Panicum virgatum TaxID=38727 RepID=A0A8T0N0Y8_PANVG|nr:hypothetical protein PVAP13_9NG642300 [Panicum virgatum]
MDRGPAGAAPTHRQNRTREKTAEAPTRKRRGKQEEDGGSGGGTSGRRRPVSPPATATREEGERAEAEAGSRGSEAASRITKFIIAPACKNSAAASSSAILRSPNPRPTHARAQ